MPTVYAYGDAGGNTNYTRNIKFDNLKGVEGMPYQFLPSVDRRLIDTTTNDKKRGTTNNEDAAVGRKYAEKIITRVPLLFLTPCTPLFMDDFTDKDKSIVTDALISGAIGDGNLNDLIEGKGRYYSVRFAYKEYYEYVNCMLSAVSSFLGIANETIPFPYLTGNPKISDIPWQYEMKNSSLKTYFNAMENVVFYLDGLDSVSESFSNGTTQSSLASQINGFADQANEIRFLFGQKGSAIGNIIDSATEITSSMSSGLSQAMGNLGGGIVESLMDKGVNSVINGGKIVFPEIWSDSSYDKSYSLNIKLRSPDHDSLSIFLNVLKPYCKILAMALPRLIADNPNGYRSPFLIKAYCKGMFAIDMGIITGINVTKGATCCWNDDGLPTQLDISLDIKDLYSNLAMSGFGDKIKNVIQNTSYMDFLANMAGLNINAMEIGKKIKLYYYLAKTDLLTSPATLTTKASQYLSSVIGKLYKTF